MNQRTVFQNWTIGSLPGELALSPGELALLPGELALLPGELALSPGELALLQGELALWPGELALLPGKLALLPGELALLAGRIGSLCRENWLSPVIQATWEARTGMAGEGRASATRQKQFCGRTMAPLRREGQPRR